MADKIFVLTGPTATGKTALGVLLAQTLNGEVVSADSMQIYRGLDIGTAKPKKEEMLSVPHHMLDIMAPEANFSVANYVAMADPIVQDILARGKVPIIVGGTGLYIEGLVRGASFAPRPSQTELRRGLEAEITKVGGEILLSRLAQYDPLTASRLFPNDHKRIVRALEVVELTGKPLSLFDAESQQAPPRYEALQFALNFQEREDLRQRIAHRVDIMMAEGLLEEVEQYLYLPSTCSAMQAIGYKELRTVFTEKEPLENAVELLKIRSRQYAKRQITWFRNRAKVQWYNWKKIPNIQDALQVSTDLWTDFRV